MSNSLIYKDIVYKIGDTLSIQYKIKEGDKERMQIFKGILVKVKGDSPETRMITVRKITKSGIGVERIIPLQSPYINEIKHLKKANYVKAKAYFIKHLSEQELRNKLYKTKNVRKSNKTSAKNK